MEHDVNELFQSFQEQVNEISRHANQVSKLKFSANLKNGTSFRFHYDADTYGKGKVNYKPLSVFNAIVDIIGAMATISLMVLHIQKGMWIICSVMMLVFFCTNAVMHLLDERRERTISVLFSTICAMKTVFLCFYNFFVAQGVQSVLVSTLSISALSLLLLSMQTKGAERASAIILFILPFMNLLGGIGNIFLPGSDALFGLWALGPAFFGKKNKVSSNSIFALIGLILAAFPL